jgi:uncharacterized protein involved in exopolysaccharide biosynthesis
MDDPEGSGEGGGGGVDPELLRSYLHFLRRALRAHRGMLSATFLLGLVLTVVVFRYMPRTFSCTTVLMVDGSQVLEGAYGPNGLSTAEGLILRHDNLEQIVRDTDLMKKFRARRPPLPALKDRVMTSLFGELSEKTMMASLVGTLESRLGIKIGNGTLSISVDWSDGRTAAELAEAARESFVKTRHVAEMSAFEEKLTILEGHATGLREEIETLAKQARTLLEDRANNVRAAARAGASASADAAPAPRPRPRTTEAAEDTDLPRLKEELERKKKQLADFDRDHEQRVQDETRKLQELKLRLTPSHPDVVTEERRLATIQQVPSDIALLRSEVQSMEGELKQRELLRHGSSGSGSGRSGTGATGGGAPGLDPLPGDIVQLLDAGQIDPALAAQLSSAISKYAALRDEIRSGRIQFDTAQAAFNFRYKVVIPADPPTTPVKPKAAVLLGGGIAASLLLAILLPILAELRTGLVVERWQVAMIPLPVLAELRLPPVAGERDGGPQGGPPG